ncbi:Peptidase B [Vibrio stylophorae]|uniref:Peptidase B n=1 Tax=Vibrio stylophorae TaxID=659351 RepID=A0ABN8DSE5_9VIBR|nr:aminopeptidase PepB [Vibrio stylophorae]CAH0532860.1 Peptidase B [Vibrio stylophorae]
MSAMMHIRLCLQAAAPMWGDNVRLSFDGQGALIHIDQGNTLEVIQQAARKLAGQGIKQLQLAGEGWDFERCFAFYQGFRDPKGGQNIQWPALDDAQASLLDAHIQAVNWARDMINQPAEAIGPEQLSARAAEWLKSIQPDQVQYKIIKGKDLLDDGWQGIYTVGRGSKRKPAMLRLDYNPTGNPDAPVDTVLVGKGITFDSGGYSLKPSSFMEAMKSDMGGAAMAVAGLGLAMMRGVEKRIKLVLCCAENMVSGEAYKLGDIITYKNGKTVEVLNTDAEGRLVLADGLIYASSQHPRRIIDCATLTGAAKMALGNDYHALLSFDDQLSHTALTAAREEHEALWPLPLAEIHRGMLSSSFADLANVCSGQYSPGASTAAGFLSHFVDNYETGWLHFDCSATYRKGATDKWAAGGTGVGVRTLARILAEEA